jgi:hypothetical protein
MRNRRGPSHGAGARQIQAFQQPLPHLVRRSGSDLAGDLTTTVEEDDRRYRLGAEATHRRWRDVGIDLHELAPPGELARQILEHGTYRSARPAPRRPDVDHHRNRGPLGNVGERRVQGVSDPRQRPLALGAPR